MLLGLFDSGSGGMNTVRYIKKYSPEIDLVYLIDKPNAPYGIKSEKELVDITRENVKRLTDLGACRVLIACCTASTVHGLLPSEERSVSVPIVKEVARAAKISTRLGRIGVIGTSHTVNTHIFKTELTGCAVYERALGELVGMIDQGLSDATTTVEDEEILTEMLMPLLDEDIDTLVLGCTHFPALIKTITKITRPYGVRAVIDSALIGAQLLAKEHKKLNGLIKTPRHAWQRR